MSEARGFLLALEGGGSHSQAVLMDLSGQVLGRGEASDVNTNFTGMERARQAVQSAVQAALGEAGVSGAEVRHFISSLVGPRFGADTFGQTCPNAEFRFFNERDVIFARAGLYCPHGVAVVSATGATAWAIRADDGRSAAFGGWGSLLGDEGSAYAAGLLGIRQAVRAFEGRAAAPTRLVDALCEHFGFSHETFHPGLVRLAYSKPLSRADVAGVAPLVTRLALEGDVLCARVMEKVSNDLAALALHAARALFTPQERFDMAGAGGMFSAGEIVSGPLLHDLAAEFPLARFILGTEEPAVALGKLALEQMSGTADERR
jgi:N-acetylglucosamine kinase-like BadF-type ATPase